MRHNKLSLFVHLNWTTWDRLPLIDPVVERQLHRNLQSQAEKLGCKVYALNGTEDHVHLLIEMPATMSISEVMKSLKGVSSHFVNETLQTEIPFKWQASYSAFTVSRWDVRNVVQYIEKQKEHHASGQTIEALESTFRPEKSEE